MWEIMQSLKPVNTYYFKYLKYNFSDTRSQEPIKDT